MDGCLSVSSKVDVGSVFTLELVLSLDTSPVVETIQPHTHLHLENDIHSFTVLLVEDNLMNVVVAKRLLKSVVAAVPDVAMNGQQAVDKASNKFYDVILMDIQMPVMDGLEATRIIKAAQEGGKQSIIVAFTANAMAGYREVCMKAGCDDYLVKPVMLSDLKACFRNIALR